MSLFVSVSLTHSQYEMIVGESPFYDENEREMLRKIVHEPVSFPDPFDPDAQSIIERFLVRDPSSRLGAKENGVEEIKAHPFFQDIDWFKLEHRQIEAHWKPRLVRWDDELVKLHCINCQ